MIQRLYVHNFRCLENFEITLKNSSSSLFIGKNGSGKSTIGFVLEFFQQIGRGVNRVGELIEPSDFTREISTVPIRFEIEVLLNKQLFKYLLLLELPEGFKELRVAEEQLIVEGSPIYSRKQAQVNLAKNLKIRGGEAAFYLDWHLIALPIIQKYPDEPISIFQVWLSNMLILSPIPTNMAGDSSDSTLHPKRDVSNFGDWFTGLLLQYPAAYSVISDYMQNIMPDFDDIRNEQIAKNARNIILQFRKDESTFSIDFNKLSDGEKCFLLCSLVLASNKYYPKPLFCFWDEPDNYLSLSEVGHFIMSLRRSFKQEGQLLVTSHSEEAIRKFSDKKDIFVLDRKSHLEPTLIRTLDETSVEGDLVRNLIAGDIEL
jgi:AAA15 family ATPase/GTPase